jgi:hypothetical protein
MVQPTSSAVFTSNATRDKSLMISFASSMRFLASSTAIFDRPVKFPPGRLRLATSFRPTGSGTLTEIRRPQRYLLRRPIRPAFVGQARRQERRIVHTAPPGTAFLKRCSDLRHSRNHSSLVAAPPNKLLLVQHLLRATKHQFGEFFLVCCARADVDHRDAAPLRTPKNSRRFINPSAWVGRWGMVNV